ncbi:uncharacterized protein LOC129571008, partial [Sitodiplosis mosellana]|uniref:uncharacterized protein LOC129571008 n=1 Tax=Sitodiplosis mosellana TaxID=263140 RepID=UPI002444134C
MTTTLSNPHYTSKSSDTPTTPATASFDEFAQSRANASNSNASIKTIDANERSNLSTSFAIPSNVSIIEYLKKRAEPITNKFMLAPPSASTINIRRNSTQQAASSGAGSNQSSAIQRQSISGETTETSSIAGAGVAAVATTATTKPVAATTTVAKAAAAALSSEVPPPVPKRTFLGKIIQSSLSDSSSQSPTSTIKTTINNVCKQTFDEVKRRNNSVKPAINQNQTVVQRRLVENHYPIDQQIEHSDDDRLSIESSVFEEPKSSDPIISLSNRSSSDSNKSQTTIDTGYMSASNDNDRIFFGASEDFRSRFSSVDTQSSIDSCTSSDLQTHQSFTLQNQAARCIISPLAVKRDEYEDKFNNQAILHGKTFSRFNSSNSLLSVSNKTINSNSSNSIKNQSIGSNASSRGNGGGGGGLNANRNVSMAKILPQVNGMNGLNHSKTRPVPPPAPSRTQPTNSLDSGRILYNGSMLGAFQSGLAKITSAAATTSEVVMGRRSFKKASQIAHTKLTQRQDSSITNDSFSLNSSPSYNTKQLDAPILASTSAKNNSRTSCLNGQEMVVTNNHSTVVDGFSNNKYHFPGRGTLRQDSTISNDSFSLNSSPGYNTKQLEQPLLAHSAKIHAMKQHLKCADEITKDNLDNSANSAIIKSASTPASLQAVVRFQNGSNMSLQHKVINRRKSSNPYITRGILKFRLLQILLNALALLIIAGGLAAYFKAYPTVKFINKTIITPQRPAPSAVTPIKETPKKQLITGQFDKNPAPGICLPIIVKFCQIHQVPYNYTIYPNYIGHFSQIEAEEDLEPYEAIVDVQCYELASLFLCTLFVPKCGTAGLIPPCKSLCMETMRRCRFFFNVFGLELPDYLSCHQFSDSNNPDICVGQKQMRDAYNRALKP